MSDESKDYDVFNGDGETAVATRNEQKLKKPRLYKVLLHNDDYTSMEFVVMVLTGVFHMAESQAVEVMLHVHQKGVGTAGVYTYEIAETKIMKVTALAREHDFPLKCSMESE